MLTIPVMALGISTTILGVCAILDVLKLSEMNRRIQTLEAETANKTASLQAQINGLT